MFEEEKRKRYQLAETLGGLAELIIQRMPPFDKVSILDETHGFLQQRYFEYYADIEQTLRDRFISSLIVSAKETIKFCLKIYEKEPFGKRYPDLVGIEEIFYKWVVQKEGGRPSPLARNEAYDEIGLKAEQLVKQVMKERKPEFIQAKAKGGGHTTFTRSLFDDTKVLIDIDWGVKRGSLNFAIGMNNPEFYTDIANYFGNAQANYWYNNSEEVIKGMHQGLDVIDMILPHFVERVEEVLKNSTA